MASPAKSESIIDKIRPFLIGGASGMAATTCIQPIDTVKVRIQIMGEGHAGVSTNPLTVGRKILTEEGLGAMYKGLDSALLRQATYTTTRLGIYSYLFDRIKREKGTVSFGNKFLCSTAAGFFGALVGTPADLCLVRFQSDSSLPVEQRRNYKNVVDAFGRIVKEEGVLSLWKGSTPTVLRALAMNICMLVSNDEIKERICHMKGIAKPDKSTVLAGAAVSGFIASFASLPFDNIKTKLQKQKAGPDGKLPYSSFFDCFGKTVSKEGVSGLWIGFFPTYYIRIAPHIMITFLVQDFLNRTFAKKNTQ